MTKEYSSPLAVFPGFIDEFMAIRDSIKSASVGDTFTLPLFAGGGHRKPSEYDLQTCIDGLGRYALGNQKQITAEFDPEKATLTVTVNNISAEQSQDQ